MAEMVKKTCRNEIHQTWSIDIIRFTAKPYIIYSNSLNLIIHMKRLYHFCSISYLKKS